ncbi:DUF4279 domain-containing protein [Moraxella oblonga]|uniref:DUF4279 domain-containing protein n=1 Tax=Moraxella oblonga TaxID=200413 RepID=UPI0008344D21|nr:DUF4279 domain-containing protein [Moraxella oblonga]
MEQTYFYLTITGNGNAHEIKEQYNLSEFQAYNQGDYDECYGYLQYQTMCLRYPEFLDDNKPKDILSKRIVGKLLKLPKEFKITVYAIYHTSTDSLSHGFFIEEQDIRALALLKADFIMCSKLHYFPLHYDYPNTVIDEHIFNKEPDIITERKACFMVSSYQYRIDEIAKKIGFMSNDESFNVGDKRFVNGKSCVYFSSFKYKALKGNNLNEKIKHLADELYPYKDNILSSANDMDIECWVNISGSMPDEYQLTIAHETLLKFAQMRLSLDFRMYFENGY